MVRADVEVGGTDQTFNLLMGRRVQRHFGMKEQDILTTPLLEGLDGVKKMSKSLGNYIALDDAADDMFGKIMSLPDVLMGRYFALCTDVDEHEIVELTKKLSPRDLKARLAFEIVKLYHGEKKAKDAEEKFKKVFSKKEVPGKMPEIKISKTRLSLTDIVLLTGKAKSKSEARRLILQGGVYLDGVAHRDPLETIELKDFVMKIGKKDFFRFHEK